VDSRAEVEKYDKEIKEKYKAVFSTVTGKEVLIDILLGMAWLDREATSPEALAVHNARKTIMRKCGMLDHERISDIIDASLSITNIKKEII